MALAATAVSWGLCRPLDSCTPSSSCSASSSSSCNDPSVALIFLCSNSRVFSNNSSSSHLGGGRLLFNGSSGPGSWIVSTKTRHPRRRRRCTHAVIATTVATKEAPPSVASVPKGGVENLVIIGSGPAGYTAAIYAARANLKPVVFEGYQAGGVPGGQLMTTTEVENFPGFPEGIAGPDLMDRMRKQAERWGAELRTEDVEFVDVTNRPFTVKSCDYEVKCHSLIIATGATARRLGLPREQEFWSRGISACAICDGASPLFKGQELAVAGGGDTAAEEALYLTKYACHVHLLVRRDQMRASRSMQDRILDNANVTVHFNTQVVDIASNEKRQMSGVIVRDTMSNEEKTISVKGLFYGIGHQPNSQLLEGQVDLDNNGYVLVRNGGAETSVHGVYAAGDLKDPEWRQAVTAAGSGCMAALAAERYLAKNNLLVEFHQPKVEVTKKQLTSEDVDMGFDITLSKHKGQYALRKLYHESPRLLIVLYTSPTCGPCRTLKPMLGKVIDEYEQDLHFVEIDIEEDPEIAEAAGIMGTPCVQFFKQKEMLKSMSGVKMKKDYREFIENKK